MWWHGGWKEGGQGIVIVALVVADKTREFREVLQGGVGVVVHDGGVGQDAGEDLGVLNVDAGEEGASVGTPVDGTGDGEGFVDAEDVEVAERGRGRGVGGVGEDGWGGDGDAGPGIHGAGLEDALEGVFKLLLGSKGEVGGVGGGDSAARGGEGGGLPEISTGGGGWGGSRGRCR